MPETPEQSDRADRLRLERENKATTLAVEQALREQRVDMRLKDHDDDIREIRKEFRDYQAQTANQFGELTRQVGDVTRQLTKIETTLPAMISEAIRSAADKAKQQSVSTRQFLLGVLAIIATLLASGIASGHL